MAVSFIFHGVSIFENFYKTSTYLLSTIFFIFFKKTGNKTIVQKLDVTKKN